MWHPAPLVYYYSSVSAIYPCLIKPSNGHTIYMCIDNSAVQHYLTEPYLCTSRTGRGAVQKDVLRLLVMMVDYSTHLSQKEWKPLCTDTSPNGLNRHANTNGGWWHWLISNKMLSTNNQQKLRSHRVAFQVKFHSRVKFQGQSRIPQYVK